LETLGVIPVRVLRAGIVALALLLVPSVARAELLRVELKIFGMD
jgi:hypothetical protein